MSSPWIFVTPSSRGIGFALTRHLLKSTSLPILATARSNPNDVKDELLDGISSSSKTSSPSPSERLTVVPLDVTDESTIADAASQARSLFPQDRHHLHLALAVPGILHPEKSAQQVDAADALMTYRVNTLGPLLLMKHFCDFLPRKATPTPDPEALRGGGGEDSGGGALQLPPHAVWAAMSARVGSVSDNRSGGWYSYRSSKAAVNALVRSFDVQVRARSGGRAVAVAYHPGTVRTGLSREFWGSVPEGKLFSPEDAARRMLETLLVTLGTDARGRCWDYKGEEVPP